jgi:hypothetical protein
MILGARKFLVLAFAVCAFSPAIGAQTFMTPSGSSVSDGSVSASATFAVSTGEIVITLSDLLVNPKSVGQLVSDLQFSLSGVTGTSTLTSSFANMIFVAANGSTVAGTPGSTGWGFGSFQSGLIVCVVCPSGITSTAPNQLIIGPPGPNGVYSAANSSIAGNGPHNPFLNQSATFTILNSTINASTLVSNVVFSFGTTFGSNVSATPELGTFALFGTGLLALAKFARRRIWI